MKNTNIVVVGSINMDLVVQTEKMPTVGETVMGNSFAAVPGGKGANQAVAASRLGAQVSMIGCVGDDAYGRTLLEHLRNEALDTSHIAEVSGVSTGVALIQVNKNGDNSIVVVPGANGALTRETILSAEEKIRQADVLLVQLEIPLTAVEAALEIAHAHGVTTILNPAPAVSLPATLLEKVRLLTPNETEAAILSGLPEGEGVERTVAAVQALLPNGNAIVTHGSQGAYYAPSAVGSPVHVPACSVQAVDTTAAGDCFNAAVAVQIGEGRSVEEAIAFAARAAAISVTRFGAQTSLPTREEVERFGDR